MLKGDLELGVDMVSDLLCAPVFDRHELERERAVVVQEIGQAHDTPDDLVFDNFQQAAFPDQPLGRPVLGSVRHVSDLSREALVAYKARNYTARRMVLSAAGALDHERLVALAEDYLGAQ